MMRNKKKQFCLKKSAFVLCALLLMTVLAGCTKEPTPAPQPDQPDPTQAATQQPAQKAPADQGATKGGGGKSSGPALGGKQEAAGEATGGKGSGPAQGGPAGGGKSEGPAAPTATPTPTPKPTPTPCQHKWKVSKTVEANCKEDGYELSKCEYCGKENTKTIKSNGEHELYLFSESAGTCTSPAERQYACSVCGLIAKTETGGYGDHSWWVESQAPDCTNDGGTYSVCQTCGEEKLVALPATGHNYVDGVCQNCGDVAMG